MKGPSLELYKKILERFPDSAFYCQRRNPFTDDIYRLKKLGCKGAIVGKAIYEGLITLKDLANVN